MNQIKELTAHIRRLDEKGYIVDYNTPKELNNVLNQIDIVSELLKPTDNVNIEAIAEKEYPINEYSEKEHSTLTYKLYQSDQYSYRNAFIKGYKQAISKQHTPTWIEIKSEDDLPKDEGYYWVINSFDDIFIEYFSPKDIIDRDIWLDHRTHYQPIHKPQPPNKLH